MPCMIRLVLLVPALLSASACGNRADSRALGAAAVSSSSAAPASAPSAPASAQAARPLPSSEAVNLERLQGRWKVKSSSGAPDHGNVFLALIDQVVRIEGDRLSFADHASDAQGSPIDVPVTKIITLLADTRPQAVDLRQTSDAKGWSRLGVAVLRGATLVLCVNFPQNPRPDSVEPADDGREVAVLERLQ
jgi:uncharacterized protein (TIGR03067 family)